MNLGKKIKELRKNRGYSQEVLAELMNVSSCAVSKWESSLSYPDLNNLVLLANLFNVSVDYLLDNNLLKESESQVLTNLEEMIKNASYQFDIKKVKEVQFKFSNSFLVIYTLARYLFNYGFEDDKDEELDYSLTLFFKALELMNTNEEYIVYSEEIKIDIINIYLKKEKYSEAIDFINKFHVINSSFLLGICFAKQKINDKALENLSKNYCETVLSLVNVAAYQSLVYVFARQMKTIKKRV